MAKKEKVIFRNFTKKELIGKLKQLRIDLLDKKMQLKVGKLKDVHEVKKIRKQIAKIITAIKEKGETK